MLPSGLTLNSEDQFCCPYDTTLIQASGPERGSNSAAAHDFRSSGPPLFGLHGYLGTAPKAGPKLDFLTYFVTAQVARSRKLLTRDSAYESTYP